MADLIWVQPDTQMDQDGVPEKKILKKLIFKKNQQTTKKAWKYSQGANVNPHNFFRYE